MTQSSFSQIPNPIIGDGIILLGFSVGSWDYVRTMPRQHTLWYLSHLKLNKNFLDYFAERESYIPLCRYYQNFETSTKFHQEKFFWVIHEKTSAIVGQHSLTKRYVDDRALMLGFSIHPDYQNMGFGSRSARILASAALDSGVADLVCAATSLTNLPSINALLTAGFTEVERGPHIHGAFPGPLERRFLMTRPGIAPDYPAYQCVK
jgi:RimJ/RimL family protein N-acetyltransferase